MTASPKRAPRPRKSAQPKGQKPRSAAAHVVPDGFYKDMVWNAGALVLNVEQLVVIGSTAVLSVLLYAMFKYTRIGIAMQASSPSRATGGSPS